MENIVAKSGKTWWVKIYLSGPLHVIEQTCREECLQKGLCVTVDATKFIYTGGEEFGAVIGLICYPKFPSHRHNINMRARNLALKLLNATCQHSVLIMTPEDTEWLSVREK